MNGKGTNHTWNGGILAPKASLNLWECKPPDNVAGAQLKDGPFPVWGHY